MTTRGPLARMAEQRTALYIKPLPDVFDGKFFAIGYYVRGIEGVTERTFVNVRDYTRERDAKRALRNLGYVQEGKRWIHKEIAEQRAGTEQVFS